MRRDRDEVCCFSMNDHDIGPTHEPKSVEASAKSPEAAPSGTAEPNVLLELAQKILALPESGQNAAQLRQLRYDLDMEISRRIDQALEKLNEEDLGRLIELRQSDREMSQSVKQQLSRTDLTIPEMLLLAKVNAKQIHQAQKSLAAQKERIQRKRRPGARRWRGTK